LGWSGTLSGARGGTGTANTGLSINLGSGSTGYLLTSDSSGNATWQAPAYLTGAVLLNPSADQSIIAHNLFLTNGTFISGSNTGPQGSLGAGNIQAVAIGAAASFIGASYINTSGSAPTYWCYKSRSTSVGSFVAVQNSDTLGRLLFFGDDGTQFKQAASIVSQVDSAVSTGIVPGALSFNTANSSGVLTEALQINHNQTLTARANIIATTTVQSLTGFIGGASTGGTAGNVLLYSPTTSEGSLEILAANNGGNFANILTNASTGAARTWTLPDATGTIALTSQLPAGAALTASNDTNVTLTLGGSPTTALLAATSLTLGWTGRLAVSRGGTGISSFGTGVATALGQNVTGSGGIALATSPSFTTPTLGAASATSINFGGSTLSTYVTNTWTPTIAPLTLGDWSVSYAAQTGVYTQVGNVVTILCKLIFTPTFTTAASTLVLGGLPVTINSLYAPSGAVGFLAGFTFPATTASIGVLGIVNTTTANIYGQRSTTTGAVFGVTNITTGVQAQIYFTMSYFV
jgi:hypothetical protein